MKKTTKRDPRQLLASRRARLERLLALEAPDIILANEMRLVTKSQREVYGRWWNTKPLWQKARDWAWYRAYDLRQTVAPRCECGHLIWPWQERAYDPDLGKDIHRSCGDDYVWPVKS